MTLSSLLTLPGCSSCSPFSVGVATINHTISFESFYLLLRKNEVTEDRLRKVHIQTALKEKKKKKTQANMTTALKKFGTCLRIHHVKERAETQK